MEKASEQNKRATQNKEKKKVVYKILQPVFRDEYFRQ